MPTSSLPRILLMGLFCAHVMADCCWRDSWANSLVDTNGYGHKDYNLDTLWMRWDQAAQAVKCGLSGNFQPGTKCTVENFKDDSGNIQALTSVTFGSDTQPFKFRLGLDPGNCKTLPKEKVVTGWEGWGVFMWEGHEFDSEPVELCKSDYSA